MIKRKFRCKNRNCGYEFIVEIFEPGEAEEKKRASKPVRCPKCGGPVEMLK